MKPKAENGATYIDSVWGYVIEKNDGKWVRQHRLVMERHLGRKLSRSEVVHHIDGDRTNNSIDNLSIMSDYDHKSLHSSQKGRHSEETKLKMKLSALRVASDPNERATRSDRARNQHEEGKFGRRTHV